MNKTSSFFTGVILTLVLATPTFYFYGYKLWPALPFLKANTVSEITPVSAQGFGSLSDQPSTFNEDIKANTNTTPDLGSAKAVISAESKMISEGYGGGGCIEGDCTIYPYEVTTYQYNYTGPTLIPPSEVTVFKRVKTNNFGRQIKNLLTGFDLGFLNLNHFQNLQLQSFEVMEDKDFGYSIFTNLTDETISINQNWRTWPNPWNDCNSDDCYNSLRLQFSDIPADEILINIAKNFLQDKQIDISNFGEPQVENTWKAEYSKATDKSQVWIPDNVSVIFPLMIEGQPVVNEYSGSEGLRVNIDIRENKVSGVYTIQPQNFQSSIYPGATDIQSIMSIIQKGGRNQWTPENPDKIVTLDLGEPNNVLVQVWKYDSDTGVSENLFVPGWQFPILNPVDTYKTNITIPLAADLLVPDNDLIPVPLLRSEVMPTDTAAD